MMPIPELTIKDVIEQKLNEIKANTALLDDIFSGLPAENLNDAKRFFATAKPVPVLLGWPREPGQMPCLTIAQAGEQEIDDPIGSELDEELLLDEGETPVAVESLEGTWFTGSYRVTAWAGNADLTIYLQAIAKQALLEKRGYLTDQGLYEQVLAGGDFEPAPQYIPDFVFLRAVTLNCRYLTTYIVQNVEVALDTAVSMNGA